jgi:hypothetical protein
VHVELTAVREGDLHLVVALLVANRAGRRSAVSRMPSRLFFQRGPNG